MTTAAATLNRASLADWYRRNRERSRQLFDIVRPEAYYSRPISLRHPIVFYEGHLPAFSVNTLVKKGLGRPGVDEGLERLFARGIDPEDEASASHSQRAEWPTREEVWRFAGECDALILDALANAPLDQPGHPLLHEAQAVFAILEHEAMHQETMLYMWHQLPYEQKRAPANARADAGGATPVARKSHGSGWPRHPWRPRRRDSLWLGQRVPRPRRRRAGLRDRRSQRDQRTVHGLRRRRRLPATGLVDAVGIRMGSSRRHRASRLLVAARRSVAVARHVRGHRPATRVAGLRQPGGGGRIRALEGRTPAHRSRVPPSRLRRPIRSRAAASVGRGASRCVAGPLRLRIMEPGRGRTASRRARAPGACTT